MPASVDHKTLDGIGPFRPTQSRHALRSYVDTRTDEDILGEISKPPPVTSERNVWAWWDAGIADMRPWCQRNVVGWVRILGPDWTVRVLDNCENSPSHWSHFLNPSNLPACLVDRTLHGDHARTLSSDIVRLPCLAEHGGVWMDVGILLLMDFDRLCWHKLEDPACHYKVALFSTDPAQASNFFANFFIAARKGNALIQRWMQIYLEAWKDRTHCRGISDHPLFRPLLSGGNKAQEAGASAAYSLDYFAHMLALDRVRLLEDPTDGFSGPSYFRNHVFLLEYRECAMGGMLADSDTVRQFKLLSTRYDRGTETQEFKDAQQFCDRLLSETAMMKLYHRHLEDDNLATLADVWDRPENRDADHEPGTFAEYLRYNSIRYVQLREIAPVKVPSTADDVIFAGLLEVDDE